MKRKMIIDFNLFGVVWIEERRELENDHHAPLTTVNLERREIENDDENVESRDLEIGQLKLNSLEAGSGRFAAEPSQTHEFCNTD